MAKSESVADLGSSMARPGAGLSKNELLVLAELAARESGTSFTAIRRHVYEVLLDADVPLGAYDILGTLEGVASTKPITAYRALDWLEALGLVRKIRSLAKYVALWTGPSHSPVAFLVCKECGLAEEVALGNEADRFLSVIAKKGYSAPDAVLEIIGCCAAHTDGTPVQTPNGGHDGNA